MVKENLKFVNFSFGMETVRTIKEVLKKPNKLHLKEHTKIHFYSIERISELEAVFYFTYHKNYGILTISFNGKCNILALDGNMDLLIKIFKSEKDSDMFKNNKPIIDIIRTKIKQGCHNNIKRIAEKNRVKFVKKPLSKREKEKFKDLTILDGNEKMI